MGGIDVLVFLTSWLLILHTWQPLQILAVSAFEYPFILLANSSYFVITGFHLWNELWRSIFSFDLVLSSVAVLIVPGGFKGGCIFIAPRCLPPWAELGYPSPVLVEKRGARAGVLSSWLDPRPLKLGVLAGKAEILGRSLPPLPFGTRVPDCLLARELVAAFFCWKRIGVLQNYPHWKFFCCSL